MLNYRGYIAKTDFDEHANVFSGVVINSRSLISFEGGDTESVKQSFHDVVDSHLQACKKRGISPEKPYSGKFNVRISPLLHEKLAIKAAEENLSQNKYIEKLFTRDLESVKQVYK